MKQRLGNKGKLAAGAGLAALGGVVVGKTLLTNHKEKKMARTGQYAKYLKSKGETPGA